MFDTMLSTCHVSCVKCHMSYDMDHLSYVTCHNMFNDFFIIICSGQIGGGGRGEMDQQKVGEVVLQIPYFIQT